MEYTLVDSKDKDVGMVIIKCGNTNEKKKKTRIYRRIQITNGHSVSKWKRLLNHVT